MEEKGLHRQVKLSLQKFPGCSVCLVHDYLKSWKMEINKLVKHMMIFYFNGWSKAGQFKEQYVNLEFLNVWKIKFVY
jgi:hypothetical protein